MMERPTFSQSWSRVSKLTPTLRPQVEVSRHLFRGEPWHVVHDPVSNSFFRLNPVAHHFVGLLDGKRLVDDAWRLTLDRFGDLAPTQNEVIGLLGQLNQSNLLRVDDLPPDAAQLLDRYRQRRMKWWAGQFTSLLFWRFPVFNPEPVLKWTFPLMKPLLSKGGLLLWFCWMAYCIVQFLPHVREFFSMSQRMVLNPGNWVPLALVFIFTKAWHELGHGLVCKRFGGVVPEFGIMLLVLFPAPYMDATASWGFPSKWRRLLVGAAGMIFELPLAGAAALMWIAAEPESMVSQVCYNLVFISSISTILFNANPLLRFDGYYMLSDLLEMPNLYSRAQNQMKYIFKKYAYGMKQVAPVAATGKELFWLTFYGIAALIYRVLILSGIIFFIAGRLFELGLILAAWSITTWLFLPLGKFFRWLFTNPALQENRVRAITVTALMFGVGLGVPGLIPMDDHRRAQGVVESTARTNLSMQTSGFIKEVRVVEGQYVNEGDVILVAENPQLESQREEALADLERLRVERIRAIAESPVAFEANKKSIEAIQEKLEEIELRLRELELRSPQAGTITPPPGMKLKQFEGRYMERGSAIARVEDFDQLRVTAVMTQAHSASGFLDKIESAEMRFAGRLGTIVKAVDHRVLPGGETVLPHPALSHYNGGPIAIDTTDPSGLKTLRPVFYMHLTIPNQIGDEDQAVDGPLALPGQRVYTRFTLSTRKPLMVQWYHRIRQLFRDRLGI